MRDCDRIRAEALTLCDEVEAAGWPPAMPRAPRDPRWPAARGGPGCVQDGQCLVRALNLAHPAIGQRIVQPIREGLGEVFGGPVHLHNQLFQGDVLLKPPIGALAGFDRFGVLRLALVEEFPPELDRVTLGIGLAPSTGRDGDSRGKGESDDGQQYPQCCALHRLHSLPDRPRRGGNLGRVGMNRPRQGSLHR